MFELLVTLAVVIIIGILAFSYFLPNKRSGSHRIRCVNNLKNIGLAFRIFATDHDDRFPFLVSVTNGGTKEILATNFAVWIHFRALSNELSTPKILLCPMDRLRHKHEATTFGPTKVGPYGVPFRDDKQVSYFLSPDATDWNGNSILAGDRNLATNRVQLARGGYALGTNVPVGFSKTMHRYAGCLAFSDGRVGFLTNALVPSAFAGTSLATNRVLVP